MQGSFSSSLTLIDLLIQFQGQDAQDHLNRNQNNVKTDISETFQNKSNLSVEQKNILNQFFLKSILFLFWNIAELKHEKGIHQLKQIA